MITLKHNVISQFRPYVRCRFWSICYAPGSFMVGVETRHTEQFRNEFWVLGLRTLTFRLACFAMVFAWHTTRRIPDSLN
jgi:hypothetical protein